MNKPSFYGWDHPVQPPLSMDFGSFEELTESVTTLRVFAISNPIIVGGYTSNRPMEQLSFAVLYEDGVPTVVTGVYADTSCLAEAMVNTPYYGLYLKAPLEEWPDFITSVAR